MELKLKYIFTTETDRQEGLMQKAPLAQNEGALFIWQKPVVNYVWNKNVSFPIDVGFFSESHSLINIEHLRAYQESPVYSVGRYQFILETPHSWFIKHKIKVFTNLIKLLDPIPKELS